MYNFLLQLFLISSLVVITYLMARALPRVQEADDQVSFLNYMERWVKKLPLAKVDKTLATFTEKSLRKVRVVVMKFDNFLNKYLANRKINGNNGIDKDFVGNLKKEDKQNDRL